MVTHKALGKGLSALLGDVPNYASGSLRYVSIESIQVNPNQPRKIFDKKSLQELANSIHQEGILQPLLVHEAVPDKLVEGKSVENNLNGFTPYENRKYEIIAGERRYQAAKITGIKQIPVIVKDDLTEKDLLTIGLIENIQREDLNPMEEAGAYSELIKKFNYSQEEMARFIGKSRSYIANILRLNQLPESIKTLVKESKITIGHARALIGYFDALKLAHRIIEKNMSVRAVENWIRNHGTTPEVTKATDSVDSSKQLELKELEQELSQQLQVSCHIQLNTKNENGKLIFHFQSMEKFDKLMIALLKVQI